MKLTMPTAIVETHFLEPTDHKPSRVVARHVNTGQREIMSWDYEYDTFHNHRLAAMMILGPDIQYYSSRLNGGYVFVKGEQS